MKVGEFLFRQMHLYCYIGIPVTIISLPSNSRIFFPPSSIFFYRSTPICIPQIDWHKLTLKKTTPGQFSPSFVAQKIQRMTSRFGVYPRYDISL